MSAPIPPSGPTPPAGNPVGLNPGRWHIFDKIAVGAGLVALLFSFFSAFITVSIPSVTLGGSTFGGGSVGRNAWHGWAVIGLLLMIAATALVVIRTLQPPVLPDTAPWPLITAGAASLGVIIVFLRGVTYSGVSIGWSGWVLIIAGIIAAAATVIPLTSAAGSVESKLNNLGRGPTPSA